MDSATTMDCSLCRHTKTGMDVTDQSLQSIGRHDVWLLTLKHYILELSVFTKASINSPCLKSISCSHRQFTTVLSVILAEAKVELDSLSSSQSNTILNSILKVLQINLQHSREMQDPESRRVHGIYW